jgi:hypothetical protein
VQVHKNGCGCVRPRLCPCCCACRHKPSSGWKMKSYHHPSDQTLWSALCTAGRQARRPCRPRDGGDPPVSPLHLRLRPMRRPQRLAPLLAANFSQAIALLQQSMPRRRPLLRREQALPSSPHHSGQQRGKVAAAACYFPLSAFLTIPGSGIRGVLTVRENRPRLLPCVWQLHGEDTE